MRVQTLEPHHGRTIVIGDVHGCYEETLALFEAAGVTERDRVVFAGDLVDRGPHPRECVELGMKHHAVLGNHEENHLLIRRRADERLSPSHQHTRRALTDEHYDWFEALPDALVLPEHDAVIVHAGLYPDVPLAAQQPHHVLHIQYINPPHPKSFWPSRAPEGHAFWTNFYRGPQRVIFGHTVLDRPLVSEFAVGIDTGCCYGRSLTAVILPEPGSDPSSEWRLVSVPSRQPPGGRVPLYAVQDGVLTYS